MWEPLFCTGGKLGFFREPCLVPPPYFLSSIYASGSGRHHLLGCQRAATPALGPRAIKPPRGRGHSRSLAWPEAWLSVLCGGQGGGGTHCYLELDKKGGPRAWKVPLLAGLEISK